VTDPQLGQLYPDELAPARVSWLARLLAPIRRYSLFAFGGRPPVIVKGDRVPGQLHEHGHGIKVRSGSRDGFELELSAPDGQVYGWPGNTWIRAADAERGLPAGIGSVRGRWPDQVFRQGGKGALTDVEPVASRVQLLYDPVELLQLRTTRRSRWKLLSIDGTELATP